MNLLINQVFKLIAPRRIQVSFEDVSLSGGKVLIRPTYLSICAADQRYYMGARPEEYLKKKLPMALIHEAAGEVVYDDAGRFKQGEHVVLIPNTPQGMDPYISENYLVSSKFRASGYDGFMQEYVAMDSDRLIKCNGIDPTVASVCELASVAMHAVNTFLKESHGRREVIGIWGDGNLAYMIALMLSYKSESSKIVVTGVDPYKLGFFSFVDRVMQYDDMPHELKVDHAFECVGGQGAQLAIQQIVKHINSEGTIVLMGVSEQNVSIQTRTVLEKGLRMIGRSRSGRADFVNTVDIIRENPEMQQQIRKILTQIVPVSNIKEISETFEQGIKTPFKTIMKWNV